MCEACPTMINHNEPPKSTVEDDVVLVRRALDYPNSPHAFSFRYREALEALDRLAELAHRYEGLTK